MTITSTNLAGYVEVAVSNDGQTTLRMGDSHNDYRLVTPEGYNSAKGVATPESIKLECEIEQHNEAIDAAKVEANKSTEALRTQLRSNYRKYACGEKGE